MTKELPILDLARAMAACWVMLAHLTLMGGHRVFLLSQGSLGVEVFIFISGFLMTLILKDDTSLKGDDLRRFYVRRFFRIAPSFYFAILLYLALRSSFTTGLANAEAVFQTPYHIAGIHDAVTWRTVLLHLLFLHGLFADEPTKIFGPAWSLSLEMQFYLVAPLCIWALRRRPFTTLCSLFTVNWIGNLLVGVYGSAGLMAKFVFPSFLPNRIFLFFLGGTYCLYLFERRRRDLTIFISSTIAILPLIGSRSWLVCLLLIGSIHAAVSCTGYWRALYERIATSRATHLMAEWSYGIYLYHMLWLGLAGLLLARVQNQLPHRLLWPAYALTVIVSSVLSAAVLHHFFEKPTRAFGKKLSRTRTPVLSSNLPLPSADLGGIER